jgi:hypothetical protein
MEAYEDMICNTATDYAPWYVAPADNKWFTRVGCAPSQPPFTKAASFTTAPTKRTPSRESASNGVHSVAQEAQSCEQGWQRFTPSEGRSRNTKNRSQSIFFPAFSASSA